MASQCRISAISYRSCVSNFDSAYFMTMQIRIKLVTIIILAYILQPNVVLSDSKTKLLGHVEQDLKSWISLKENVSRPEVRLFITPETTFPGCPSKLKFRKSGNQQNVIQIGCNDSKWMTEIRYSVIKDKKSYIGYIFQKNLRKGHKISESDIEMSLFPYSAASFEQNPAKIIGKFTTRYAKKGERIRKSMLDEPVKIILATKFIPKGKVIETSELEETEVGVKQINPQNQLLTSNVIGAKANKNISKSTILSESHIKYAYEAIAAKERILRNHLITSENTSRKRFWGREPSGALKSIKNIENMEVSRSLRQGEIVKINDLRPAKLVSKGDVVTLTYVLNNLELVVSVESLEDGRLGDKIRLKNTESGEVIRGKVTGKGLVTMWR